MTERRFPVLNECWRTPQPRWIPWSVAERAYAVYNARYPGQSLERLAERGGFGPGELDEFVPGWRDEAIDK